MRAIFKNWSLFWAEQKEDQRSHQQVELSGKDGSSCTEGSRLSPLRLRPKSVMLATVGDKKFINLTGLSLSQETMLMRFSRTVSRGGPFDLSFFIQKQDPIGRALNASTN